MGGCLVLCAVVIGACSAATSSPAAGTFKSRHPGVLTVATDLVPSPGFWEGTARHPTGGLEYELARDLAVRFGLKSVQVRLVHFHRIVQGQLGGADLALALITPTDARENFLEFSSPYLSGAPTVLARAGTSVPDLASAQALKWGAVRATTFVPDINKSIAPDAPLKIYDNTDEMIAALEDGEVDAVLQDMAAAVVTAKSSDGRLKAVAQLPTNETVAAALPRGSHNLDAVNSALRAFTANGTLNKLIETWVGSSAADSSIPLLHTTR
jgi:ABC-type amino acid transport substrate-binding protein